MADVACLGIMVADIMVKPVDSMPARGLLEQVDQIELHTGGNAMTAAINLRTLGVSSAVIGRVGCDPLGDFLISELVKKGIDVKNVSRDKNAQTSSSAVMISSDGERSFMHCVGANGKFRMSDVDRDEIDKARIIFVTGIFLLDEFDRYDLTEFLKECKKRGKITAADVCWDSAGRWQSIIDPALPYIDYFLPSIDEAREIAKENSPEACADKFFEKGVKYAVIKMGKDGCYAAQSGGEAFYLPACRGVKAVDTTGAGDSFCSGFLAALSKNKDFKECVRFANAAGGISVMSTGATTGMKSYDEVLEFMKEHS